MNIKQGSTAETLPSTEVSSNLIAPSIKNSRPKVLKRTSQITQQGQTRPNPSKSIRVPPKTNLSGTSVRLGCIERYTWMAVFDENTRFCWSRYVVLLDPAKTLVSLVLLLSGRQRWTSAEHVALGISVSLLSLFLLCLVSVSVFGTIQRRLACPSASVDTHQSRSVVKFHVAQFQRCGACFPCFLSREGICAFL